VRALRFNGQSVVIDTQAQEPELRAGEAVVRPMLMGVSASDIDIARGLTTFAGIMGQEFVGVVDRVSDSSHSHLTGQRVVASASVACATCDLCRRGLSVHCRARAVIGLRSRDGCFADRVAMPVRNLHLVPNGVSDEEAVFAELVAAALHTRNVFKADARPYVTVLGDGALGLLTVQAMAKITPTVRLVGRHEARLALCDRWGIRHRLQQDVGHRQDQDVVIDCTGSASGLESAIAMVRPRGKIVLKQTVETARGATINVAPIVTGEIELIGSRGGSIAEALGALATKQIDVLPLITKRGKLVDGPVLIPAAQGQIKVVLAA
jgi:threonine dehydrogenase-like Zn-dependent dehydrogenase